MAPPHTNKLTRVDGIGLWRSWTRNFNTKTLALLDLIDNSLDAAIHNGKNEDDRHDSFRGKVHVYPDVYESAAGYRHDHPATTTGLCIVNNSIKQIRPLKNVLEVYNSSKVDSGAGDIGENGVGLKQGCATLSDLSFVLMKNGSNKYIELGIVAKDLQRLDGCYLPAFNFSNDKRSGSMSLKDQMISFFSEPNHSDVAKCIAQYGAPRSGSRPSLSVGVERICRHFDRKAFDDPYVFMVILDKVHNDREGEFTDSQLDAQQKITVNRLMKELTDVIPRTYLHVPQTFSFIIGEKRMNFDYWPRRLIELTSVTVYVNTKIPWQNKFDLPNHQCTYPMRIFLGFDGTRMTDDKSAGKEASLYVYSRQSGRLITHHADARTRLGLQAGGTEYSQGLTIIIDDFGGNLPLNPTKQEVAFGEETHGAIHEVNLMAWVGSVAQFYYQLHLHKVGGKKKVLTNEVNKLGGTMNDRGHFKPLDGSNFTTYNLSYKSSGKYIRVDKSSAEEFVGPDTIFRLCPKKQEATKSKEATSGQKRKAAKSDPAPRKSKKKSPAPPPSQAISSRQRQHVSYADDDESNSDEEENEEEEEEDENSYEPPPKVIAVANSTATRNVAVKAEPTDTTHRNSSEKIFEDLCDRLTNQNNEIKAENRSLKEENNQLRAVRIQNNALRQDVHDLQSEIAALREENKALREKCARKHVDYERLEFLVNDKAQYESRI